MAVTAAFWARRRVLITGHTGFKGSWLALWLQQLGAEVTGYALPPATTPALFTAARVDARMTSVIGDVRDLAALSATVQAAQPEVIFHLAAQPLVLASYEDPVGTYATNAMGTVHLLEAARHCPSVRAIVNVTTDKCYANLESRRGYQEDDRLGGHDPYSNSKACAELITAAYRDAFFSPSQYATHGVAIATARAGNVIGGGDWAAHRLIPDLLTAFATGETAIIRRPDAVRPWQHVLEPLHGYLQLAERLLQDGPAWGEGWNFGPQDDEMYPVHWIADRLATHWGRAARWIAQPDVAAAHETTMLCLDSHKARHRLGWQSRWSLDDALQQIVAWEQARGDGADMQAMTLHQIERYSVSQYQPLGS